MTWLLTYPGGIGHGSGPRQHGSWCDGATGPELRAEAVAREPHEGPRGVQVVGRTSTERWALESLAFFCWETLSIFETTIYKNKHLQCRCSLVMVAMVGYAVAWMLLGLGWSHGDQGSGHMAVD